MIHNIKANYFRTLICYYIRFILCFSDDEPNPWLVESLDEFIMYTCEECSFQSKLNEPHICSDIQPIEITAAKERKPLPKPKKPSRLICHFCPEVFLTIQALMAHREKEHKTFPCKDCDKVFPTFSAARNHWSAFHRMLKCQECDKTFNASGYHKHMKAVHVDKNDRKFKCGNCPFASHAQRYVTEHRPKCPGTEKGRQKIMKEKVILQGPFKCHTCQDEFNEQRGYVLHYRRQHGVYPPEFDGKEKIICAMCPKEFLDKRALNVHVKKDHPENCAKNFTCDKCDSVFTMTFYLAHYRKVHKDIPPEFQDKKLFLCDQCPQVFVSEKGLNLHVRSTHIGKDSEVLSASKVPKVDRMKKCPECPKMFRDKGISHMREHVMVVHRKKTPFKCDHCPREFGTHVRLKGHLKNHTKALCDVCLMEISSSYKLERHKGEVHGLYPQNSIRCEACPMYFYKEVNLDKHRKKKHEQLIVNQ